MSTHGFVGIGTPDQFHARYNHADSYPTGLGAEVWAKARQFLHEDAHLHGFAHTLLSYTDWRQMSTAGLCPYCGQATGQPHSICGVVYTADAFPDVTSLAAYQTARQQPGLSAAEALRRAREEWSIIQNLRRTGYPDPEARYHQHETLEEADLTPDTLDWLFMEWGYVIDPETFRMHVLVGCIETPVTYTLEIMRPHGDHAVLPHNKRYTGALLASYDLREPEPSWAAVAEAGYALRKTLGAAFAADPTHPLLAAVRALPPVEVWD
ncbi:hypothetical protein [Sulfobacillus sp. hq2]|uniref:hypothetical protein n=1 Tax=Sulfobacillus sp. hq2 TaxID=2039167 RepID=UPI000CD20677|nr:hypothetical protein [Sulfobacillus sp. hq2]POB12194.1 hypothetical protein CO251_00780 [Sulfobacillus sp. hq2]